MDALPDEKLNQVDASRPASAPAPAKSGPPLIVHFGADIDVAALEEEIRAEVAHKEVAGVYPPELLLQIGGDPVRDAMEALQGAAELSVEVPIRSSRPGLGRLISLVKRLIAAALRWHTRWLVDQVQALGGSTIAALEATQARLDDLERRLDNASRPRQAPGARLPEAGPGDWNAVRMAELTRLQGPGKVACLGCGEGDFLARLSASGSDCYGVEADAELARSGRVRGLDVRNEDLLEHLATVTPGSLAAVIADVDDRLDVAGLEDLLRGAAAALAPGGVLMVEVDPGNAGSTTSRRSERMLGLPFELLAQSAGFSRVRVDRPVPADRRLRALPEVNGSVPESLMAALNANLQLIDAALFGVRAIHIVARR